MLLRGGATQTAHAPFVRARLSGRPLVSAIMTAGSPPSAGAGAASFLFGLLPLANTRPPRFSLHSDQGQTNGGGGGCAVRNGTRVGGRKGLLRTHMFVDDAESRASARIEGGVQVKRTAA